MSDQYFLLAAIYIPMAMLMTGIFWQDHYGWQALIMGVLWLPICSLILAGVFLQNTWYFLTHKGKEDY